MRDQELQSPLQQSYTKLHESIKGSSDHRKARVESLINFGVILLRGGLDEGEDCINLKKHLTYFATWEYNDCGCYDGPEGEYVYQEDIEYAIRRSRIEYFGLGEKSFASKVREWISYMEGTFSLQDAYTSFNCVQRQEKERMRVTLHRLCKKENLIERNGSKGGIYRIIQKDLKIIDLKNIQDETADVKLPLDLHELVKIQPKNIIMVAGEKNSGKTVFCLNTAMLNMGRVLPVRYITSEMGGAELAYRLKMFEPDIPYDDWVKGVEFIEEDQDFQDKIKPEGLNIIDYLKLGDDFFKVGSSIKAIFSKMTTGVTLIAMQKKKGSDLAVGGRFTTDESRLYIALESGGVAKIVSAKNWKDPRRNPNNLECDYHIIGGARMRMVSEWCLPDKGDE